MGSYNVKLEYIKATDTVKQVCLLLTDTENQNPNANPKKCVYVLNQDKEDDSFSQLRQSNKTALKFKDNTIGPESIIHNMYNTKDMFYKSAIYDKGKSERNDTTYDFKNIFLHNLSQPYKDVIQVQNTLYAIADFSEYGHINIDEDSYQFLAQDNNNIALPYEKIQTYLYNKDVVSGLVNKTLDNTEQTRLSALSVSMLGINYDSMLEIPGSIYNEHDSGNIAANTFKGKNQYNSLFNMAHSQVTGLGNVNLSCARQYIKIDNCNNQIYFKYYDNKCYTHKSYNENARPKQVTLTANINNNQTYSINQCYQNIESIDYISRYANQYGHKSNLYSVVVKTDIFNEDLNTAWGNMDPEDKAKTQSMLKNNITNFVKTVTKRLMPAHTQLFSATVR